MSRSFIKWLHSVLGTQTREQRNNRIARILKLSGAAIWRAPFAGLAVLLMSIRLNTDLQVSNIKQTHAFCSPLLLIPEFNKVKSRPPT